MSRRSGWLFTVFCVVIAIVAGMTSATASVGNTRTDPPSTTELAGGNWLGGAGVDVYSNGSAATNDYGRHYTAGVYDGEMWQCVELVNRLYLTRGWIASTWFGNGNQLYANAPAGLDRQPNGSVSYLNPGDVITFDDGGYGHAGVIATVSGGSVQIVNQNTPAVWSSATWSGGTLTMAGWQGYRVQGIVHAPVQRAGSTPPRLGVLTNDGHMLVKEGDLRAGWVDEASGIAAGVLSGNRVGVLNTAGVFSVKEGDLRAGWVDEFSGVTAGYLSGNRLGVLTADGHFLVKEGDLRAGWVDELSGVTAGYLSGNRLGVLTADGHFLVKEGDLRAAWVDEASGITAGVLNGNRVGVLNTAGVFSVKEGDLRAGWVDEASGITAGVLSGNRVGVLNTAGVFSVKEGDLRAGWVDEASGITDGVLNGNRVGVLNTAGTFSVKEGDLRSGWVDELVNVRRGYLPND